MVQDYVLVDWEGEYHFVGIWPDRDEVEPMVQTIVDLLHIDPDFHSFSNFPIVCLDPEVQARVTIILGASVAEIEAAREKFEAKEYYPRQHLAPPLNQTDLVEASPV